MLIMIILFVKDVDYGFRKVGIMFVYKKMILHIVLYVHGEQYVQILIPPIVTLKGNNVCEDYP